MHARRAILTRNGYAYWDTLAGLGEFLELELVVEEPFVEDARAVLLDLAGELHLGKPERRSYLELLLANSTEA